MRVELTVNGIARVIEAPPLRRLLDILREDLGLTGTKEGCGEGECGACAVLRDGALVDACLVPAFQLDGVEVTTIEGLGTREDPDPVQTAFAEEGAVQCGFCIPGMVMAARALLDADPRPDRARIRAELAGNLCRCTGYERIVRAVERAAAIQGGSAREPRRAERAGPALRPLDDVLRAMAERSGRATPVAGATDLMSGLRAGAHAPEETIDLMRVQGLAGIARSDAAIEIGATTTLAEVAAAREVQRDLPSLAEAAALFGAPAIRNRATVGGNIVTASPAADLPPVLLALGARVVLASAAGRREIALEDLHCGYRRTALGPGELLVAVRVPVPGARARQAFYKVGTRRAQSIAKVSVACVARVGEDGRLSDVRIAAGSVAPVPVLLRDTMAYLAGRAVDEETIVEAARRAADEVRPIDDVRSTARYRRIVAGRLVARFLREDARGPG